MSGAPTKAAPAMTLNEVKRLCERVLQLPDDLPLHSVEVYEALWPVRAVLAKFREGCTEEVKAEIDRRVRLRNSQQHRKHRGTGALDTPEESWEQMRQASLAGESWRSIARRFGVLYNALTRRVREDEYDGRPWRPIEAPLAKVIPLRPRQGRANRALFEPDASTKKARGRDQVSEAAAWRVRTRRHPGTGIGDTSEETWERLRVAYEGGEPLGSAARRLGVLASAAAQVRRRRGWHQTAEARLSWDQRRRDRTFGDDDWPGRGPPRAPAPA